MRRPRRSALSFSKKNWIQYPPSPHGNLVIEQLRRSLRSTIKLPKHLQLPAHFNGYRKMHQKQLRERHYSLGNFMHPMHNKANHNLDSPDTVPDELTFRVVDQLAADRAAAVASAADTGARLAEYMSVISSVQAVRDGLERAGGAPVLADDVLEGVDDVAAERLRPRELQSELLAAFDGAVLQAGLRIRAASAAAQRGSFGTAEEDAAAVTSILLESQRLGGLRRAAHPDSSALQATWPWNTTDIRDVADSVSEAAPAWVAHEAAVARSHIEDSLRFKLPLPRSRALAVVQAWANLGARHAAAARAHYTRGREFQTSSDPLWNCLVNPVESRSHDTDGSDIPTPTTTCGAASEVEGVSSMQGSSATLIRSAEDVARVTGHRVALRDRRVYAGRSLCSTSGERVVSLQYSVRDGVKSLSGVTVQGCDEESAVTVPLYYSEIEAPTAAAVSVGDGLRSPYNPLGALPSDSMAGPPLLPYYKRGPAAAIEYSMSGSVDDFHSRVHIDAYNSASEEIKEELRASTSPLYWDDSRTRAAPVPGPRIARLFSSVTPTGGIVFHPEPHVSPLPLGETTKSRRVTVEPAPTQSTLEPLSSPELFYSTTDLDREPDVAGSLECASRPVAQHVASESIFETQEVRAECNKVEELVLVSSDARDTMVIDGCPGEPIEPLFVDNAPFDQRFDRKKTPDCGMSASRHDPLQDEYTLHHNALSTNPSETLYDSPPKHPEETCRSVSDQVVSTTEVVVEKSSPNSSSPPGTTNVVTLVSPPLVSRRRVVHHVALVMRTMAVLLREGHLDEVCHMLEFLPGAVLRTRAVYEAVSIVRRAFGSSSAREEYAASCRFANHIAHLLAGEPLSVTRFLCFTAPSCPQSILEAVCNAISFTFLGLDLQATSMLLFGLQQNKWLPAEPHSILLCHFRDLLDDPPHRGMGVLALRSACSADDIDTNLFIELIDLTIKDLGMLPLDALVSGANAVSTAAFLAIADRKSLAGKWQQAGSTTALSVHVDRNRSSEQSFLGVLAASLRQFLGALGVVSQVNPAAFTTPLLQTIHRCHIAWNSLNSLALDMSNLGAEAPHLAAQGILPLNGRLEETAFRVWCCEWGESGDVQQLIAIGKARWPGSRSPPVDSLEDPSRENPGPFAAFPGSEEDAADPNVEGSEGKHSRSPWSSLFGRTVPLVRPRTNSGGQCLTEDVVALQLLSREDLMRCPAGVLSAAAVADGVGVAACGLPVYRHIES